MKNTISIAVLSAFLVGCAGTPQPEIISDRQKAQIEVTNINLKQLISKMNFEESYTGVFYNDESEMHNLLNQETIYTKACIENKLKDVNLNMFNVKILKDTDMNKYVVVLIDKDNPNYKRYFHESKLTCELSGRGRDFIVKQVEQQKQWDKERNYSNSNNGNNAGSKGLSSGFLHR